MFYAYKFLFSEKPATGSSFDTEKASEAGASMHSSMEKGDHPDDQPQGRMILFIFTVLFTLDDNSYPHLHIDDAFFHLS